MVTAVDGEEAVDVAGEVAQALLGLAGDPAQRAVLERGDTTIYERDIAYLERHRDELASAGA